MTAGIFLLVLFAAFLHAFWNAIVKGAGDKAVMLGLIALGHVVPGLALVLLSGLPSMAAVPYIIASTVIHWVYYILLNTAYRVGDLSVVYPIARGLSPILIALGAQFWVGETLPLMAWMGILAVSVGIMILAAQRKQAPMPMVGFLAAVGVAVAIASYSIVDGVGVRLSGNALGYIGCLFTAEAFVVAYVFGTKWDRVRAVPVRTLMLGLFGGIVSGTAYALVLIAKTQAPLGIVSALRETSVIFAALIGVLWFQEGPKRGRIAAAIVVGCGIAVIAGAKGS
ncbi:DMT family transporter [Roseovarius pelagicus]|uniref:DMT family transporter n=1 Tax=Roseovarius pelagicus TaxID=2980108 RepID=A0ABY6DE56_9RHOB|nr:DMT family transporter [Roseovarius pelagicus]UXX83820.1 DMT family transporter [Roseovarius pelagicus]